MAALTKKRSSAFSTFIGRLKRHKTYLKASRSRKALNNAIKRIQDIECEQDVLSDLKTKLDSITENLTKAVEEQKHIFFTSDLPLSSEALGEMRMQYETRLNELTTRIEEERHSCEEQWTAFYSESINQV